MGSLRRTSRTLIAVWFTMGFPLLLLTLYVHRVFAVVLVALQAVVGIGMMRLRCRHCSHPIHMHCIRIGGRPFSYWAPWISQRCVRCHAEIS